MRKSNKQTKAEVAAWLVAAKALKRVQRLSAARNARARKEDARAK